MENHQTETQKEIKSDKYQTRILIAVALIILGVVFFVIALNQPRESSENVVRNTVKSSAVDKTSSKVENKTTAKNNAPAIKSTNKSVSFPINLNTCTAEDLMAIDNVGETRANAIIAYR
ncbi:MAG: helix-hairpin-helix domain-containing protein, partial [Eubacterium sp.]|nr:helix-hairpin-helix domain-containing protein [Eubacterium sp.]